MMPTIRVDDAVFQALGKLAAPFVDTPNSVIKRLLEEKGVLLPPAPKDKIEEKSDQPESVHVLPNALTPQSVYEVYLLFILRDKFKGRGGKHEVTREVIDMMKSRHFIGPPDLEVVSTGETKAENTVAWARNALKERGYISRNSPRGIWELTDDGMDRAKQVILPRRSGPQS